jgi:hypothetical protein
MAREVKDLALELQGHYDQARAQRELAQANEALAIVLVDAASRLPDGDEIRAYVKQEFSRAALDAARAA